MTSSITPEDTAQAATDRVDEALSKLTLRQKVGQLNQRLYGWECVRRTRGGYELTDALHEELEHWQGMGALYGLFRSDAWSGRSWDNGILPEARRAVSELVQDAVRQASPQGVGALFSEEAPHGHQALGGVLLPVNLASAASWDPGAVLAAAQETGALLRADGVHLALVSTLDLLRDPRWGRSEECFGENPRLASVLTEAVVHGFQGHYGSRIASGEGPGVVLKHFVAQGEGIGGRNGQAAMIGERDLRELHLAPALAGVQAGAVGVMSAYTDIDGVPCSANSRLLNGILRRDLGFEGIVMADGKAIDRLVEHLGSHAAAAAAALHGGVDLSLWDLSFGALEETLEMLPELEPALDAACRRVLALKDRFGLLGGQIDPAHVLAPEQRQRVVVQARDRSRELAALSAVLVHNSGVLPISPAHLSKESNWVVGGPYADTVTALLGDYVPPLKPGSSPSIFEAIHSRAAREGIAVTLTDCHDSAALASAERVILVVGGTSHRRFDDEFADNGAAAAAGVADSGEGVDRASLELPLDQCELVRQVRKTTTAPIVAIVVSGRPYVLTDVVNHTDAVLFAAYPGPEGSEVLADILLGDRQPLGRLAAGLPAHAGAIPVRADERHRAANVYRDAPQPLLAPFGFGLGYATVNLNDARCTVSDEISIELELVGSAVNDGWQGPAEEVVQVYVERRGSVVVPRKAELIRFTRVAVEHGSTATCLLRIPLRDVFICAEETAPLADVCSVITLVVGEHRRTFTVREEDMDWETLGQVGEILHQEGTL